MSIILPAYGQSSASRQTQGMLPTSSFPPASLPQNGGRLGVELDPGVYVLEGRTLLKVIRVLPRSDLLGRVAPNDYIYNVNGFDVRNHSDLFRVVQSGAPGASIRIGYLSAGQGLRPFTINARLYGADETANLAGGPTNPKPQAESEFFCTQGFWQGVACLTGAVVGLSLLFGSSSPSSGNNSSPPTSRTPCPPNYYETFRGGCKCALENGCPYSSPYSR
jgi:hypothetical protein